MVRGGTKGSQSFLVRGRGVSGVPLERELPGPSAAMNRSRCTLAMTEAAATDTDRRSARTAQRTGQGRGAGRHGEAPLAGAPGRDTRSVRPKKERADQPLAGPPLPYGQTPAAAASARPVSTLARCRR